VAVATSAWRRPDRAVWADLDWQMQGCRPFSAMNEMTARIKMRLGLFRRKKVLAERPVDR